MTESTTCPMCGQPLKRGLAEPEVRAGGGDDTPAPQLCVACGWSSIADVPGAEGGANGGA